ncbi:MAG TPA: hypothetical protein VFB81_20210 [Myxococcales bacterium]|nr:hypothetical protein [Myxococcales bacterium]
MPTTPTMPEPPDDPAAAAALARLQRATDALGVGAHARREPSTALAPAPASATGPAPAPESAVAPERRGTFIQRTVALGGLGLSLALGALSEGEIWMIVPAVIAGLVAGLTFWASTDAGKVDPTRARVGMGATIGEGARLEPGSRVGAGATLGRNVHLEPGASVGMGASVGAGVVLRRDAQVRAGATIAAEVVLEAGAVVASGADVGAGATVAEGARVGTGAIVGRNAYVPPGMVVRAGTNWNNTDRGTGPVQAPRPALAASAQDPRAWRIDSSCAGLEGQIQRAPPQARAYLGASLSTVRALRETCHGLLRRETALRAETSDEAKAELERARAGLQKRLDAATDEHVRKSLASALAAIDEQQRQRALMARTADRLDAELTRLLWTMDGMSAQLARLRTAGAEVSAAADVEVSRAVKKLQDEIGAIADALEEIAADQRGEIVPVSDVGGGGDGSAGLPVGQRERG